MEIDDAIDYLLDRQMKTHNMEYSDALKRAISALRYESFNRPPLDKWTLGYAKDYCSNMICDDVTECILYSAGICAGAGKEDIAPCYWELDHN